MRLKVRDLRTVYWKKRLTTRDNEANVITSYEKVGAPLKMNVQSSDGQLGVERYGERLKYYKNCKYQGTASIKEGDGICVDVSETDEPDYKVRSILDYSTHQNIELERILKDDGY